jgi:hypothetical protein
VTDTRSATVAALADATRLSIKIKPGAWLAAHGVHHESLVPWGPSDVSPEHVETDPEEDKTHVWGQAVPTLGGHGATHRQTAFGPRIDVRIGGIVQSMSVSEALDLIPEIRNAARAALHGTVQISTNGRQVVP